MAAVSSDGTVQMTANPSNPNPNHSPHDDQRDTAWVSEVLAADNLRLAGAKRLEPYGRAKLGRAARILMWSMRVYVVLSFILIIMQIYISLKPH